MIRSMFTGLGLSVAKRQLDASALRQKVISNNIANVNTPGFKRSDVSFEDQLMQVIQSSAKPSLVSTHPRHFSNSSGYAGLSSVRSQMFTDMSTSTRMDENNVDIDREMVGLAKNQIKFESFTKILGSKYSGLRSAITEGRR